MNEYDYIYFLFSDVSQQIIPMSCINRLEVLPESLEIYFNKNAMCEECSIEYDEIIHQMKKRKIDYVLLMDKDKNTLKSFHIRETGRTYTEFFEEGKDEVKIKFTNGLAKEL